MTLSQDTGRFPCMMPMFLGLCAWLWGVFFVLLLCLVCLFFVFFFDIMMAPLDCVRVQLHGLLLIHLPKRWTNLMH